jgi:DnaJ-class molecular chaperone
MSVLSNARLVMERVRSDSASCSFQLTYVHQGVKVVISQQNGFLSQQLASCGACQGTGRVFNSKDKCKKCKGKMTVPEKKMLELYIPPGAT